MLNDAEWQHGNLGVDVLRVTLFVVATVSTTILFKGD
jgi:hypothetical protein